MSIQSPTIESQTSYQKKGFSHSHPIYDQNEIDQVNLAIDEIVKGNYETGIPPYNEHKKEHLTQELVKIDNTQISNKTIHSFLTKSALGEWVAKATGSKKVQIWATQLLIKRPSKLDMGGVGWHRDINYWGYWEPNSELFTAWIALSDVKLESGPVCMVEGSQTWPDSEGGNFFEQDLEKIKKGFLDSGNTWKEEPMVLSPGAASLHHKRTIHGSYSNTSNRERRSIAIHLCNENAKIKKMDEINSYVAHLDDPAHSPVIWDET